MGGIQKNTVNLANQLADLDHDVHVVYMKKPLTIKPNKNVSLHFLDINNINRLSIVGFIYDVFSRIILRAIFPGSSFLWRGVYGSIIFRIFISHLERASGKFDLVVARGQGAFEHIWLYNHPSYYQVIVSPIIERKPTFLSKIYSKALFKNKNIIANSEGVLRTVQNHFTTHQVTPKSLNIIYNPCPIQRIKELAEQPANIPDEPYIVNVARLCPQKNHTLLLEAYKQANITQKLVIVGGGDDEAKIKRFASDIGISDKVLFIGQVPNPYPFMKHADLFVLSSMYEGFGLVIVESLASGTPVVAVDCPGGIRDILIEEQESLIAKPDVNSLAEKIRFALDNPVQIKENWYMRFDITKVANDFLNL
jgi:glycosyltransferase involved in cell wall biosynthesis